jgi:hypothetical protein
VFDKIVVKTYFHYVVFLSVLYSLYLYSLVEDEGIEKIVDVVIIIHVSYFIYQLVSIYVLKDFEYFKLLDIIGRDSRMMGTAGIKNIYRLSGLYIEPGTYAASMFSFIFYKICVSKKPTVLLVMLITTLLLTLSFQGILIAIASFAVLFRHERLKLLMLAIVGSTVFVITSPDIVYKMLNYIMIRMSELMIDNSFNARLEAYDYFFNGNSFNLIFGYGPGIIGCNCFIADGGLVFSTWWYFGVVGLLFILYLLYAAVVKFGYSIAVLLLLMLFTKVEIWHLSFSLVLYSLLLLKRPKDV